MSLTSAVAANAAAAAAGAGKKAAQVQLQAELNTDDEWKKFLLRDGLLVVDVYSEWCGPCIGMVGNLKKIKVEIGGDNLHLAVAKADTIECLKRFRNRSEPTWMFISSGQLINVVFGADAPRLARTIEQELRNEELVRKGELERVKRAPHELTPQEQALFTHNGCSYILTTLKKALVLEKELATAREKVLQARQQKEEAALEAAREARREARARRLEAHFADVCPALLLAHAQKHVRKVSDALEPLGVTIADKCPVVLGKDSARRLGVEEPELAEGAAAAALAERPSLALLLRKLPEKDGDVIAICRRAICGDGVETEVEEQPKKTVASELRADNVPGIYVPPGRHQRAAALDLLFPKMVESLVEPAAPAEPPHVAMVYGAWQRRAVLAAAAAPALAPLVLRYGFFADADVNEPKLLCKTIDQYEQRPEKDYGETIVLMVAVGPAEPQLAEGPEPAPRGPPAALLRLVPLHVSADAVLGGEECARLFPPGYSEPDHKPKTKAKKKKKKRHETKEEAIDESAASQSLDAADGEGDAGGEADGEEGEEGAPDDDADGEGEGPPRGEGEPPAHDKATSPPPPPPSV